MKASRCACNSINVTQYTSAHYFLFLSKVLLKIKKDCADVYCVTLIKKFTPGDSTVFRMHALLLQDVTSSRIAKQTFHFEKPLPSLLVV